MCAMENPASNLVGKRVGKWTVEDKRHKDGVDDSGAFASCYKATSENGETGFLKAFNYQYAFRAIGQSMDRLREMTERFTYERDLLNFCRDHGMRRVVSAIDYGEYQEPGEVPVPYLVFEVASGSLKTIDHLENPDVVWKLRAFHGALAGLAQLHRGKIAHQDIKPSNILVFGQTVSKISDLGSAIQEGNRLAWDTPDRVLTDMRYAPVELLYGHISQDWNTRRYGADLFMLGGLLSVMLTGSNVLSAILKRLRPEEHWSCFGGTYRDILPSIQMAFHEALEDIRISLPKRIQHHVISILEQLAHPIPEERGNPEPHRKRVGQYGLDRYISIVDRMANDIETLGDD